MLAKRKFLNFTTYINDWFKVSWHHQIIADALEKVERGELKRVIFELPPRHSKSEMVSVHFPPWVLGRNKDKSVIQASYSDGLAAEFGRQARNVVDSLEYRYIFDTTLSEDSKSKSSWTTNGRGKYNALGVGGSATGKGADILIIDDPIKNRKEADSFLIRENIWKWYRSTARTRLSPDAAIIICMTRWHDDDLVGRLLNAEDKENWTIISLPAIAEVDEEFRKIGEALWPSQYSLENLEATKLAVGSYEWSSLYQQNPLNQENQEFKAEMFQEIDEVLVLQKNTRCYVTIDPNVKEKESADYTGTVVNRVDHEKNWYIKSSKKRFNSTKLIDHIFQIWKDECPDAIGIEETTYWNAVYPFMKQAMIDKNIFPIMYPLKHKGVEKELRIRGLLPRMEAKKIYFIKGKCETLKEELFRFPKGKNDDESDALAYQDQIVQYPKKETSRYAQVREEMHVDPRTGYPM